MKIRPLQDNVLVTRVERKTQTEGGLFIPHTATDHQPNEAMVVAAGKGSILSNGTVKEMDVKVGDKILFAKNAGIELELNGEKFLMLKEASILAVLDS